MIAPGVTVYDGNNDAYEVVKMIGHGGFGFVYLIRKQSDGTQFALKTLPQGFPSQSAYDTFMNECRTAITISHQNVIKYVYIHDGHKYPDLPQYLIMEYANQGTLLSHLQAQTITGEFFSNEVLRELFSQLIEGMKHISLNLVHRDIKSDNVLIHDGVLKIADFGLAKIATENTRQITFKGIGHVKYMAPERWVQDKNTIQNDIYSMGILFYELATLQHPYTVKNESDQSSWQEAHTFQNAKPIKQINSNLTNGLVQVINKMLEKNVNQRYKNWDEIEKDLSVDNMPSTPISGMIENLVNAKVAKDESAKTQRLLREQEENERLAHIKRINYQFKQSIYDPLQEFIELFNTKYTANPKITLEPFNNLQRDNFVVKMHLPSHQRIEIKLKVLYDKDFMKERTDRFDRFDQRKFKVLERPKLNNQLILAWGYFDIVATHGFNLLLVEEEDNIYGRWYLMKNKISALYQKPKNVQEPFAIEFDGLEQAINHLGVFGSKFESEVLAGDKFIEVVNEILVQNI
ncbi:serine/threonine-protein kinase [Paenibacillus silvae]|uniref:non-specific serine/threonine protein kinase n=1 Tax=Paenibacillus silvae TaxID=1325358 RepID=A0A2W6NFC5_9BACL|nr:serine/threonine-protein kinase [Paenibacillus silvae]PZT54345.1 hypothetical protein DN757_17605 [Paenibacillus silvae]